MPVHDWSRVDAGTFHALHVMWVGELSKALNGGILPQGYYAMPEQHGNRLIADVLTLQRPQTPAVDVSEGGVAVAEIPPQVAHKLSPRASYRALRRTIAIRHVSRHQVIALLEIVSTGNKDRPGTVGEFAEKAVRTLEQGVHVMVIDILKPRAHDPQGMHAEIWQAFDDEPYSLPTPNALTVSSYVAPPPPAAYVEHFEVGSPLPTMPLFLNPDRYVNVPLETSYSAAFEGLPGFLRELLESKDQ